MNISATMNAHYALASATADRLDRVLHRTPDRDHGWETPAGLWHIRGPVVQALYLQAQSKRNAFGANWLDVTSLEISKLEIYRQYVPFPSAMDGQWNLMRSDLFNVLARGGLHLASVDPITGVFAFRMTGTYGMTLYPSIDTIYAPQRSPESPYSSS